MFPNCCNQRIALKSPLQVVAEKQPSSIATGWNETSLRVGVAPAGVQRPFTAHFFANRDGLKPALINPRLNLCLH